MSLLICQRSTAYSSRRCLDRLGKENSSVSIGGGSAAVVETGALSCCCPGGAVPCCLCAVCGAVAQLEAEAQQQAKGGKGSHAVAK
jgi:hypothetical protein